MASPRSPRANIAAMRAVLSMLHVASAALMLASFVPLTTGLSALTETEGDCDCSSRHEDGDDEDHCPPFCGACSDCAGCFHLHALVTSIPLPLAALIARPTPEETPARPTAPRDAPTAEPLHVPRTLA